jgi:hypothetical protein
MGQNIRYCDVHGWPKNPELEKALIERISSRACTFCKMVKTCAVVVREMDEEEFRKRIAVYTDVKITKEHPQEDLIGFDLEHTATPFREIESKVKDLWIKKGVVERKCLELKGTKTDWAGFEKAKAERWVSIENNKWEMRCTKHNTEFNTTEPLDENEPPPEPCWPCWEEFQIKL